MRRLSTEQHKQVVEKLNVLLDQARLANPSKHLDGIEKTLRECHGIRGSLTEFRDSMPAEFRGLHDLPARPFFRKFVPGTVFILHLGPRHAVFWPEDYLILCTRASCLEPAFSVQGKVLQILKKHAKEPNKEFGFFARTPVRGNRSIIFSEQIIVQSENKRSIDFCEQILLQSQDKRSI